MTLRSSLAIVAASLTLSLPVAADIAPDRPPLECLWQIDNLDDYPTLAFFSYPHDGQAVKTVASEGFHHPGNGTYLPMLHAIAKDAAPRDGASFQMLSLLEAPVARGDLSCLSVSVWDVEMPIRYIARRFHIESIDNGHIKVSSVGDFAVDSEHVLLGPYVHEVEKHDSDDGSADETPEWAWLVVVLGAAIAVPAVYLLRRS